MKHLKMTTSGKIPVKAAYCVVDSYNALAENVGNVLEEMHEMNTHTVVFMSRPEEYKEQWKANKAVYRLLVALSPSKVYCTGQRGVGLAVAAIAPLMGIETEVVYNGSYKLASYGEEFVEAGKEACYAAILTQHTIFKASLGDSNAIYS